MTQVDDDELRVSVREGQVAVEGQYFSHTALRGEQVVFSGRQRPIVLNVAGYGSAWKWISRTSPPVDVEDRTIHEFLTWVGRELGRDIKYTGETEQDARRDTLKGIVNTEPAEALRMRMMTTAFDWRYEEGTIYVSNSE